MFPTFASSQQGFWVAIPDSTYGMKFYRYLYNAHTTTRAVGYACFHDYTGTTYPGLEVTKAATANLAAMGGVHSEAVATVAWGWVLVEGYHSGILMTKCGAATSDAGAVGESVMGSNAVDQLVEDAAAGTRHAYDHYIIRQEAGTSDQATTVTDAYKGWVKCM